MTTAKPHQDRKGTTMFDVAVIGAGPTGLAAAALLAQNGHSVVVLERQPSKYGLPRAGHIDHEIVRILQGLGAERPIIDDAPDPEAYTWYNGQGRVLLSFPFGELSISGYQSDFMMFQPVLDEALYDAIGRFPETATVRLGAEVVGLDQLESSVLLAVAATVRGTDRIRRRTGEESAVEARYVIAADGAGSGIRGLIGVERTGPAIDERWYTVDLVVKGPLPAGINGQWCDPHRPIYIGPLGQHHQRFEMKVLPNERDEDFDEAFTWDLLGRWGVTREHVDIFRTVVYPFEAKHADRWNIGRVFLAGDAAHTMPPYMGQGLCSGIRDSANLAWKLDLVLRGVSDAGIFDSYQGERGPHVQRWTDITIAVGRVSAELDPAAAAVRDAAFFDGTHAPLPGPPAVGPGVFRGGLGNEVIAPCGTLFPQFAVERDGRVGLFHDVVGGGFILLTGLALDAQSISGANRDFLAELRTTVVALGDGLGPDTFADTDGRYAEYLARIGAVAVVVRPDYYVFGAAATHADIDDLVGDLRSLVAASSPSGAWSRVVTSPRSF